MSDASKFPSGPDKSVLSIALMGSNEQRRKAVFDALSARQDISVREFSSIPAELNDMPRMLEDHYDVVIFDADSDPEFGYNLAETLSAKGVTSVMAYSEQSDVKLAIRYMRVGVREFLTLPLDSNEVDGALKRASIRHPSLREATRGVTRVFVFLGTKGGCGVTTIASNFAVSLAQESDRNALLIDLGLPLGDAAINLGMTTEFSIDNVFRDHARLDSRFLHSLLANHASGLSVLAAPSEFTPQQPDHDAIEKLLSVARKNFDFIVVDIGSRVDLMESVLFDQSTVVYLIAQVGISELRNANRMITRFFAKRDHGLQIVINRYKPSILLFNDKQIEKALTRPFNWKIADDYASARRTQTAATPIALLDAPISHEIRKMARDASGLPTEKEEKKGLFSFFRKAARPAITSPP